MPRADTLDRLLKACGWELELQEMVDQAESPPAT
jgi:nitrogen fixation protein